MVKKNQRIWEGFPGKTASELDLEGAAEKVERSALEAKSLLRRGNSCAKHGGANVCTVRVQGVFWFG